MSEQISNDSAGSVQRDGSAELLVRTPKTASREMVAKAVHEAAYSHFGKEGDGSIHLIGISLHGADNSTKTFLVKAELRVPPNDKLSDGAKSL